MKLVSKSKFLFAVQELRPNHYDYNDWVVKQKSYNVKHKYILIRYNFREDGTKDYTKIITSNDLQFLTKVLKDVHVWENHILKVSKFYNKTYSL